LQFTLALSQPSLFLGITSGQVSLDVTMFCGNLCETDSLLANLSERETRTLRCFLEDTYLDLLPAFTAAAVVGFNGP